MKYEHQFVLSVTGTPANTKYGVIFQSDNKIPTKTELMENATRVVDEDLKRDYTFSIINHILLLNQ